MKFLSLGYLNMAAFEEVPDTDRAEFMKACYEQCTKLRATGKIVEEAGLHHTSRAKTIRPRRGKSSVTDGPFIETKEQIGGFFIVEAENMEEAVKIASLHPSATCGEEYGFGIEVRPIK